MGPALRIMALATVLLASGCVSAGNLFSTGDAAYDGLWTGKMQFTFGEAVCPRVGAIRAEIRQGIVTASVRWSDGKGDMDGTVGSDGVLQGSEVSRKQFDFADLKGQFQERTAEGTFKGRNCRGVWSLQKVRNL